MISHVWVFYFFLCIYFISLIFFFPNLKIGNDSDKENPQENWRNLNTPKTNNRHPKQRRNFNSILEPQSNPHGLRTRSIGILQSPTIYKSKKTNIINTCTFDSLVMGLVAIMADNSSFNDLVNTVDSEFSNFLKYFQSHGQNPTTKTLRLSLLCKLYNHNPKMYKTLDCHCNISEMIGKITDNNCFYSGKISSSCVICKISNVTYVSYFEEQTVYKKIIELGKNINILPNVVKKCCQNNSQVFKVEFNSYIAIEIIQAKEKNCKLSDIPTKIKLLDNDFTLSTIFNFIDPPKIIPDALGHYQCYSIRNNNKVEVYDNQSRTVLSAQKNVKPHLILYNKI